MQTEESSGWAQKLEFQPDVYARGPVGTEQLTCFKYIVRGNGQVRPMSSVKWYLEGRNLASSFAVGATTKQYIGLMGGSFP